MRALRIPLLFCLCLACGCGSLIRGNTQEIRIDSYPPGASGLWPLLIALGVLLVAASVLVSIRELVPAKVSRD